MKKKTLRFAVFFLIMFVLSSVVFAGGKAETIETTGKQKVELQLWTFIELHQKFYEGMVEDFNKQNPDVELVLKTSNIPMDQMHDQLLLSLISGFGAPDIVDVQINWAG